MRPTLAFAALLTSLVAIGPLSVDVYLPALPTIARLFSTDIANVQLTLSVYMVGFGVGQLVIGPLSDCYGRRPVLLVSMAVYVLTSAMCALAPTIESLIGARFFQALAACASPVLGRAIVRDLYGPRDAARMLSYIGGAMALAPLLGPLLGGWMTVAFGWRSNFIFLVLFAAVQSVFVWRMLMETNLHRDPEAMRPTRIAANYRALLGDPLYRGAVLTNGFVYSALFAFISGAPFVYIGLFGLSPQGMGLAFGANVMGYLAGTMISGRLSHRIGAYRLLRYSVMFGCATGSVFLLLSLAGAHHPLAVMVPMLFVTCAVGLAFPNATAIGLAAYPRMTGSAAALMGFVQMGLSALAGIAVGHGLQSSATPMAAVIAAVMWAGLAAWWWWVRPHEGSAGAA